MPTQVILKILISWFDCGAVPHGGGDAKFPAWPVVPGSESNVKKSALA